MLRQILSRKSTINKEIEEYKKRLALYNIDFADLVALSPKDIKTREQAKKMAKFIAGHPQAATHLQRIQEKYDQDLLEQKVFKPHYKYIIALAVLYLGQFKNLYRYLNGS